MAGAGTITKFTPLAAEYRITKVYKFDLIGEDARYTFPTREAAETAHAAAEGFGFLASEIIEVSRRTRI